MRHPILDRIALSDHTIRVGHLRTRIDGALMGRRSRPWTAMVAVPLEMVATMLVLAWWTWPILGICAWWFADRSWRWTWLVAMEAGLVGTQWAYIGVYSLADFPNHRTAVAAVWIGYAAALAFVSWLNRRRNGTKPTYAGY